MSYKLYANNRCFVEIMDKISELELASPNDIREKAGYDEMNSKEEKKNYNCPNCGAPITSYICEYCGTKFEKPKNVLTDEEKRESFANFVREQQLNQMQASQEWQTWQILNSLNAYSSQTQIANIRDSLNTSMLQTCNFQDQINAHCSQINVSPYQGPKVEENDETVINAEKLARGINILVISLMLFMIFILSIIAYHFSG